MPHLEWNENLKVHVEELDLQHRAFIDMANELHDALMGDDVGRVDDVRDRTLERLESYLHDHFGAEEAYMKKIGFPGLKKHRGQHKAFARQVSEYRRALTSGEMVLNSEIMKAMLNWFFAHIATKDCQYRDFSPPA